MAPELPAGRPKGLQWREVWDRSERLNAETTLPYEYGYGATVRGLFMRYDDSLDSLVFAVKTHAPATTGLREQYGVVTKRLGGVGNKSLFLADPGLERARAGILFATRGRKSRRTTTGGEKKEKKRTGTTLNFQMTFY